MIKREYAKYVHELAKSNKKMLQFNFDDTYDAYDCLKSVRRTIERHNYDLSVYRVNKVVYVEKI